MANPVPQPNQGAAAGCNCQRLQESQRASVWRARFLQFLGRVSLMHLKNGYPQHCGRGLHPWAPQR